MASSTTPAKTTAPKPTPKPGPQRTAPRAAAAKPVTPAATGPSDTVKPAKLKAKLVRDSFTLPQIDFDLIAALKQRALVFQRPAKKSELLRAGLHALMALNDARLRGALDALLPLKPGRPKQDA
jgi:hypothetical protein